MAVKIFVKRRIPEERCTQAKPLLKLMRCMATKQNGYFYGESLHSNVDPEVHITISTWQSMACWQIWEFSRERKQIQARIDALLGTATEYEVYCHTAPMQPDTVGRCPPAPSIERNQS